VGCEQRHQHGRERGVPHRSAARLSPSAKTVQSQGGIDLDVSVSGAVFDCVRRSLLP
jgi:hypothetical protein